MVTEERNYIPLSQEEQERRRPLPVGVLLSGIDTPIKTNEEKLVIKRVLRDTKPKKGDL